LKAVEGSRAYVLPPVDGEGTTQYTPPPAGGRSHCGAASADAGGAEDAAHSPEDVRWPHRKPLAAACSIQFFSVFPLA